MSTAFLSAGILGQVYAQAVADALGWRWVFGLAAPAFVIAAIAMATILLEPPRAETRLAWVRGSRSSARWPSGQSLR